MGQYHEPVMLHEVLVGLGVIPGKKYIDATVGDGGHSEAILKDGGIVLGLDQDPAAIARAQERLEEQIGGGRMTLVQANFDKIAAVARQHGFNQVQGVLFDLGISSYHLDESSRGFTFQKDEPLDMRLDPSLGVTAADLVNGLNKNELYELFTNLAQVERAGALADTLVSTRRNEPIKTTGDLVRVIERVLSRRGRLHPATKVFMSLRIAVNDELGAFRRALPQAAQLLSEGGRLAVISFHEGEDRIAKRFIKESKDLHLATKRPMMPTTNEVLVNPRSRSARLRLAVKEGQRDD